MNAAKWVFSSIRELVARPLYAAWRRFRTSRFGPPIIGFLDRQRDDLIRDLILGLALAGFAFALAAHWDERIAGRQEALEEARFNHQQVVEDTRCNRQEVLENTRFVRQVVIEDHERKPFIGIDLKGASLSGLNLGCGPSPNYGKPQPGGAVYLYSHVGCANFSGADLRKAELVETDLTGAVMHDTKLLGVNLRSATMKHMVGSDADFTGGTLKGVRFEGSIFSGVDFSEADLQGASINNAQMSRADFSGMKRESLSIHVYGAKLMNANFKGADLTLVTNLEKATLTDVCYDERTRWPQGFVPPPSNCADWG